ncbi:cupin domain-containing protein [Paucibacter sp. KBW04]|uniref:cupin domain-containing protein n=1 Tax=Paucibacter sp. KBW04 TaxID=2153361 RepID=UPI001E2F5985|nr:cupin domain-containing protein [Paucibacter sp. KBW04]
MGGKTIESNKGFIKRTPSPTQDPDATRAGRESPAPPTRKKKHMSDRALHLASTLIRNFNEVPLERLLRAPLYDTQSARLAGGTAARKLGASIDVIAPGMRACPYHLHRAQEEMFVILEGSGSLRVDGETLPLKAGDVVFIPPGPEYPHQIINSSDAPLKYLSISTRETPEIVEYPDSGKFLADASAPGGRSFETIQTLGPSLDYWSQEP